VTKPASHSHADLFIYLCRSAAARSWRKSTRGGHSNGWWLLQ